MALMTTSVGALCGLRFARSAPTLTAGMRDHLTGKLHELQLHRTGDSDHLVPRNPGQAVEGGCKNINGVILEGAEAFIPLMENAAKAEGTKINKFITLPATAQDYSPQVAEATAGVSPPGETPTPLAETPRVSATPEELERLKRALAEVED